MKPDFINQSICLSRIPKDKIRKDPKTGESWVNLTASLMKQPDKWGNAYTVYVSLEKGDSKEKSYVGKGKEFSFNNQTPSPEAVETMPQANETDLPY